LNPVISILIPTRNRFNYLSSLTSIIQKFNDERIEFLISDNSDQPNLFPADFGNVQYFRPSRVLNMTEHWNYLLHKANGTYLTFLGDDDAFIPSALEELCNTLEHKNVDLVWTPSAGYGWPQSGKDGNFFQVIQDRTRRKSLIKAQTQVLYLKSLDLPIPYNYALVKKQLILDFLRANPNENFFSSRVPDVNAGVKILFLAQTQFQFRRLIFISGASPLSNGLLTRTNLEHPAATEFNDPDFNPIKKRENLQIIEPNPFGFMTYYEAIEESFLQLGLRHRCSPKVLAFRSVIESNFPEQQLRISLKMWPQFKAILGISYRLSVVRRLKFLSPFFKFLRLAPLGAKILLLRERIVIIKGPGINNTEKLVKYLDQNKYRISRKPITKVYVS